MTSKTEQEERIGAQPTRKVFYVEVGNMPFEEAVEALEKIRDEIQDAKDPNSIKV